MPQPPPVPDCRTPDEVAAFLHNLRTWADGMSFHDLELRVNVNRLARNAPETTGQAINDCFQQGRNRLDHHLVLDIARALGLDEAQLVRLEQSCQVADGRRLLSVVADVTVGVPSGREEFTGRDQILKRALAAIDEALAHRRPPVVMFTGPAGIGKTELAVQLAQRLMARYPALSRQFFVDLHGFDAQLDPSPPAEVIAAILKLMGVRDPGIIGMPSLEQRRDYLRQTLREQRALLVLDNVADTVQLGHIVPGTSDCVVIATSQQRLAPQDAAIGFEVGPLGFLSCVELLDGFDPAGRVGKESDVAVRLINDLCGRRPFDLVALGGQLSDPDELSWSLADHADRLAGFALDEPSHQVLEGSCHRLAPETRRVFRLLSLYPGFDFSANDIAVLSDLAPERAAEYLRQLHDRHLLLCRQAHRYRLHDVVAAYSRTLLHREESPTSQRAALRRLHAAAASRGNGSGLRR